MDITSLPDADLRVFERPPIPEHIRGVYLVSICGTGMGSLAGLLKQSGYDVTGSDQHVYPPMSTRLQQEGIPVHQGFDKQHLVPAPDLVIIGNACTPTHEEATYAREHQLAQLSFPEALSHFFLQHRRSLVVAGTHGKTTTTGMLIHLFQEAGLDPGFLVGGVIQDTETSYAVGTGKHFIVEGDEYDSAYFDKRPKFMHYQPSSAIVTSMELDHTDIYPNMDTYREAFQSFANLLPSSGTLVLCSDYPEVQGLASHTSSSPIFYGLDASCRPPDAPFVTAERLSINAKGQTFSLIENDRPLAEIHLPAHGHHNLSNAVAASVLARSEGLTLEQIRHGFSSYRGLKRRQEVIGHIDDVLVLDDFAHHPTAVRETILAVRQAYPDRRLVAVFEPRSNSSRRRDFQDVYVEAFDKAQEVLLSTPPFRHNDDVHNFMNIDELVNDIEKRDIPARSFEDINSLLSFLTERARPGDVVLIMSNGGFGGLHKKFLEALQTRVQSTL